MARRDLAILAVLLLAAGLFRLAIVTSWHAPAGDGTQYYHLSQEFRQNHRYAHGSSHPLTAARLPGYPLFLAYVAVHRAPLDIETHLVRATRWNVLLDLGTALCIFFLLRERRLSAGAPHLGLLAVLFCPIMLILCCYGLTESLATFLLTLEFALAVRSSRSHLVAGAVGAGVVAGLAQLVRQSSVVMVVPVIWALLSAQVSWKKRIQAVLLYGATALVVFSPWPLRNYARFGEFRPLASEWMTLQGVPLPPGMPRWMRTWGTGAIGESYVSFIAVIHGRLDARSGTLQPVMCEDEVEKQKILAIYNRYNREYLSPAVDRAFDELASERMRRHPFRTFVLLPLERMVALWMPVPEHEIGMRSWILDLPAQRDWFALWRCFLYAFALVGAVVLMRRDRLLASLCLAAVALTTLLYGFEHAFPLERYLSPVMPFVMLLTGVGASVVFSALGRAAKNRFRTQAVSQ